MEHSKRLVWIDNTKVVACVLVVVGHFFQSMTQSGILPRNDLYSWFNQTIYCFHVPLFFICSGYLYQKLTVVADAKSWGANIIKKALSLGIPYFTFSLATWMLKMIFSSSVNSEINTGLFDTLFLYPTSPYWYLYALFFIFLVTPTFKNDRTAIIGLGIALVFKIISITFWGGQIQAINYILVHEIWFVIGMCICIFNINYSDKKTVIPIVAGSGFIVLSILVYILDLAYGIIMFFLGLLACYAVIAGIQILYKENKQTRYMGFLAKYTMPIYLMHTLFAAPFRIVLIKLGIHNPIVHILVGIIISFWGPIAVAIILRKTKYLEFFLYPAKFIKL